MLWHAVACGCLRTWPWHTIHSASGLYTAMPWHAVACSYICNIAHIIVHIMLACIRQAQLVHSDAEAHCPVWLPSQRTTYGAFGLRTAMPRRAVACGCLCIKAPVMVPMLACIGHESLYSGAVACCRMWLPSQLGTVPVACTQRCLGTLQHAVAFATGPMSLCLCWLATGKRSSHKAMLRHAGGLRCHEVQSMHHYIVGDHHCPT